MTDAARLELLRLAALVECLVEDRRHADRRLLAADDRRVGLVMMPLIGELVGSEKFSGPSLYASALEDRTPTGRAAREVLAGYGSLRALGRLLARLDGVVLAGCRLEPLGECREGRVWRVLRVSDEENPL